MIKKTIGVLLLICVFPLVFGGLYLTQKNHTFVDGLLVGFYIDVIMLLGYFGIVLAQDEK